MALTRSMLKGMGLTDEQVGAIIDEHTSVTDALKAQRDELKDKADQLVKVQEQLENLKKDVEDNDWKGKYDKEHDDFEKYKAEISNKEKAEKVKSAYRKLLKECEINDKHMDSIVRVTDFSNMELTEDGNFEDAEKLKESIKSEWAGFIPEKKTTGADVDNPPGDGTNPDAKKTGRAAELAAKYHDNLYGKAKED